MKLVYICRALFKNGGLKERPLTENAGGVLSERLLTGKTETYIFFFKRRSFRSAQIGKAEQRIVYF